MVVVPITLKNSIRLREFDQMSIISEISGVVPSKRITFTSQFQSWGHYSFQRKLAIFRFRVGQSRYRAWNGDRPVADYAGIRNDIPAIIEIHVVGGSSWRLLPVIDKMHLAVGHTNKHESAASQIAGLRMHDRERKARSH